MIVSTGIVAAPPIYGGAIESHTFTLANALGELGARVHYVSDIRDNANIKANVRAYPVHAPISKLPVPFPGWIITHAIGGILSAKVSYTVTMNHPVDVAHFHEETSAMLYLGLRAKVPVVFTLHNPPPWVGQVSPRGEALARSMISKVVSSRVIKKADHFIALSRAVANGFSQLLDLDEEKVSVVHHPVDTEFFKPDPLREQEARERFGLVGRYILFVGRLDARKGASNLLTAAAKLNPRPSVVIVGDGVERQFLIGQAKSLGIQSSTRLLGAIPSTFLPGLFSAADCLVFPSVSEMSPLTVIEALACGLPVAAFDLPVLRDIIRPGDNGFLLSHNAESLASAITLVTTDETLWSRMKLN